MNQRSLLLIPSDYTSEKNIHPKNFSTDLYAPPSPDHVSPAEIPSYDSVVADELSWLGKCAEILSNLGDLFIPGWASHHAS